MDPGFYGSAYGLHGCPPTAIVDPKESGVKGQYRTGKGISGVGLLFAAIRRVAAGERVLVTGAAGGVGTAGVQLAHATGAHVVASARREGAHDQILALGADEVIVPDETPDYGPYDVVLALVGGPSVPTVLGALAMGGRIAVIGIGAGRSAEVDLSALMYKRARISGSTLRGRSLEDKAEIAQTMEQHVLPLLAEEKIRVPLSAIYPMRDASVGYDRFVDGGKVGKIVLFPN